MTTRRFRPTRFLSEGCDWADHYAGFRRLKPSFRGDENETYVQTLLRSSAGDKYINGTIYTKTTSSSTLEDQVDDMVIETEIMIDRRYDRPRGEMQNR
ncbi:hypothetical protein RJ641_013184 [Dillenia turbinata]|uniref:Uncharacterized protein n=1 Tax=Dillenia turbinata TaxID=194707 RepID=A0AAN8W5E8_9MAGN